MTITTPVPPTRDKVYSYWFTVAMIEVAKKLEESERNEDRKAKKGNVIKLKAEALRAEFPELLLYGVHPKDRDEAMLLCIDLAFCDPFAPYELSRSEKDMQKAIAAVVEPWGLVTNDDVEAIFKDKAKALKTFARIDYRTVGKVALYGAGTMVALATTGFVAAPIIGAALGSAAGLSGAAATSYGLALLGGGSLAAGGSGMAGGIWLVTGVGATVGALGGSGGALLRALGTNDLKRELAKLQVTYYQVDIKSLSHLSKAQEVILRLKDQREELARALNEERELNDRNTQRIKDIEEKIAMIKVTEKTLGTNNEQNET